MDDPVDDPAATYAAGHSARTAGDLDEAVRLYRAAIDKADRTNDADVGVHARLSLSTILLLRADVSAALGLCDEAALLARGVDRAHVRVHRGVVMVESGHPDEALAEFDQAEGPLRRSGDALWQARLYNNRGMLSFQQARIRQARRDLMLAEELLERLGLTPVLGSVRHNLGLLAARRGDIVGALEWFARADEAMGGPQFASGVDLFDRGTARLDANLTEEALEAGEAALAAVRQEKNLLYVPSASALVAEALLQSGDASGAVVYAEQAEASAKDQGRKRWAALSRFLTLRARIASDPTAVDLGRAIRDTARALEEWGWPSHTVQAHLLAGDTATQTNDRRHARESFRRASSARRSDLAIDRVRAWHAEALLRLLDGDRGGAATATRSGLRVLDAYRATLGAAELRARLAAPASELARLGLRLALDDDNNRAALDWAERTRTLSLLRPPSPAASDPAADKLVQLRELSAQVASATDLDRVAGLRREQARVERAVRDEARRAPGGGEESRADRVSEIVGALGDRVLLELVEIDGHFLALTVADRRVRRFELGAVDAVVREQHNIAFAMRRLARTGGSDASRAAASASAAASAAHLDNLLLAPLADVLGDRPAVIVPTGALHALPWPLLPALQGRTVAVAPSATIWRRLDDRRRRKRGTTSLVAGPDLAGADAEVRRLARSIQTRTVLAGRAASADAVAAAFATSTIAHIAAHGRFRADHPMLSSLRLADGPLTVYDLERLASVPDLVVLSACDAGLSAVHPGDELMGFAATLFSLGTRSLVASVLPVPDGATVPLMLAFHRRVQTGDHPAAALAGAQDEVSAGRGIEARAAAASFVCLGAG